MSPALIILLVLILLLFGGVGLAVEGMKWLLIVCVVLIIVTMLGNARNTRI